MELYKTRKFGDFFQDTFSFLKESGKHFFKHFLIVNGIFLIILAVLAYFFTTFFSDFLFSGALNNTSSTVFEKYLNENSGIFIFMLLAFFIVALIAGIISYAFPFIYLKLYSKNTNHDFETKDIINSYKSNITKLLIFIVCSIIISIPLFLGIFICVFILMITIIGLLAIPIIFGAVMLFYGMALMEYLENKKSIWESFGYSWKLLKSNFWASIASVGIFYLISYIVQNIVTIIPYIFGVFSVFTNLEQGRSNPQETGATMLVIMLIVFFLSIILSTILNSIVQLNQGVIFYSLKEQNENTNTKSLIDEIGSSE